MSKDAPGIISVSEWSDVLRLWESTRDVNAIAEAVGLTIWEVMGILYEEGRFVSDVFLNLTPVERISDIRVAHLWEDDHLPCISFFFRDEKNRLRYAELWGYETGPGMVEYAPFCKKAYDDLLEAVNLYYRTKKEEGDV